MGHPIQLAVEDDLRRSRLTVFFRLLLAVPHLVWLGLWGVAAAVVGLAGWFAALVRGRLPDALHTFLARFLSHETQVLAYTLLAADPFPGFSGDEAYPVELAVAPARPQSRASVLFRALLALPATLFSLVLVFVGALVALAAWFTALALGRVPDGMRDLIAFTIRYRMQTQAYELLVTGRYPSLGP